MYLNHFPAKFFFKINKTLQKHRAPTWWKITLAMRVIRIVFVPDKILVFLLSLKALLWIRISGGTGVSPGGAPPGADTTNTVISRCEVTVLTTAQQCHRNPIQGWNEILPPAQLRLYMIPYFQHSRCDFLMLLGVIIPETPSKTRSPGLLLECVKGSVDVFTLGWMKTVFKKTNLFTSIKYPWKRRLHKKGTSAFWLRVK